LPQPIGATKNEKISQFMEGKFSGRLPTKEDESKLADECQLMAPLLSEDGSLCTLPTIIRAMATGSVRLHLEKQGDELISLKTPTSAPQSMEVQLPTVNGLKQTQVAQMPATNLENAIVAQQVLADVITQPVVVTTTTAAAAPPSAGNENPAQTAGVAATNLNDHAHQLAVDAKLHEAAKAVASMQAQQLAAQAQQHAQAAVQAAHQAEELKKTLSALPDTQQTQQAADIVHNLESRAQAHASFSTQVVAQARGMHEIAQVHENEQYKAITQATVLQPHSQSLPFSAQQLEVHQVVTQAVTTSGQEGRGTPFRGAAAAASAADLGRFSVPRSVGPGNCRVNERCILDCCHHTVKPMLKDPLPPKLKKSRKITKPASPQRDYGQQPPEDLMLDNVLKALYNHLELDQDLVHKYIPFFLKLSGELRMTIGKQILAFAAEPSGRSLHSFLAGVVAWHQ